MQWIFLELVITRLILVPLDLRVYGSDPSRGEFLKQRKGIYWTWCELLVGSGGFINPSWEPVVWARGLGSRRSLSPEPPCSCCAIIRSRVYSGPLKGFASDPVIDGCPCSNTRSRCSRTRSGVFQRKTWCDWHFILDDRFSPRAPPTPPPPFF